MIVCNPNQIHQNSIYVLINWISTCIIKTSKLNKIASYLGTLITRDNWSVSEKIKIRALVKKVFNNKEPVLINKHIKTKNGIKTFVKTFFWRVLLNGCKSVTLGKQEKGSLKVFQNEDMAKNKLNILDRKVK